MTTVLDEKEYHRLSLARKLEKVVSPVEEEPEDQNVAALRQLVDAVKSIADRPESDLSPVVKAIQEVQKTQVLLIKALVNRPIVLPKKENTIWVFTPERDSRGYTTRIIAEEVDQKPE